MSDARRAVESGETALGIELGSTRIKAVLIDRSHTPLASGSFEWENSLKDGVWTYDIDDALRGVQSCYAALKADALERYGVKITRIGALGVSGMMHGYLPLDRDGRPLCEFRTWRNTMTERSAAELSELFGFNVPQRWSVAHLDRALLFDEEHVGNIDRLTTLAGYVHERLGGRICVGVGEASGMFPLDGSDYDAAMLDKFDARHASRGLPWKIRDILPKPVAAGGDAGRLSRAGALLLDPSGELEPGALLAPPEGDAGTGMVATNSVSPNTGNISAGTSVFLMAVLEKPLSKPYPELDIVATPDGAPVAMVHCNNCSNEIDAWADVFGGMLGALGCNRSRGEIYDAMFASAMRGEPDCGGVYAINYLSGEPITGFAEGRPMVLRTPDSRMNFENFMRSQLYSSTATLAAGMEILRAEKVRPTRMSGHGGFFKAERAGAQVMADALGTAVSTLSTAGEGGPWGMALLAAYALWKSEGERLCDYLNDRVFALSASSTCEPTPDGARGFAAWMKVWRSLLDAERSAVEGTKNA